MNSRRLLYSFNPSAESIRGLFGFAIAVLGLRKLTQGFRGLGSESSAAGITHGALGIGLLGFMCPSPNISRSSPCSLKHCRLWPPGDRVIHDTKYQCFEMCRFTGLGLYEFQATAIQLQTLGRIHPGIVWFCNCCVRASETSAGI